MFDSDDLTVGFQNIAIVRVYNTLLTLSIVKS